MKISASFIIRFHYKEDDPRFLWRYTHFVENVLPRIYAQTYKDFDICIWCNDWHKHYFESLGLKTFNVKKENIRYKQNGRLKYFHDFTHWNEVIGLEKYDLQLGLDSDDYIAPDYLEKIVQAVNQKVAEGYNNQTIHICYQPELLRLATGKIEPMRAYTTKRGSAFMALYQPNKENYRFIYEESHMSIIRKADIKVILPKGKAWALAHQINESTGL